MSASSKPRQQKSPSTIPAALRLPHTRTHTHTHTHTHTPTESSPLPGGGATLLASLLIFLFTPRPGICESIQRASAGSLLVGIRVMNVRVKLSIFHIHNSPHTHTHTHDPPPGGSDWFRGSSTSSSRRKEKHTHTHLDGTQRNWSALETPSYAR